VSDSACANCGGPLGLRRFIGGTVCGSCATADKAARKAALAEYESLAFAVADPRANPQVVASNLPALAERAGLDEAKSRELRWRALLTAFERTLEDEVVTSAEEERLTQVARVLGFGEGDLTRAIDHYQEALFIARVNDGRLPELSAPRIVLKRNEIAHLETEANLLKEVLIREYKGGSRGMSFRIARGVSYRVGSHRGQIQVVGSELQVAATGILTVTSQRAVFAGDRKSQEVRYDKLLSLNVYSDAVQFHVSNRQNPSTFRVRSGPMVAAAVNGAVQRLEGR
jgi:hypothetical protein